jgi:DNA-binding XRE family transcriptional regulator
MNKHPLRDIRESLLISKSELARKARITEKTITRIENGHPCRIETQRKVLLALGYNISDRDKVFANNMASNDNMGRRSGVDRRQFEYSVYIPEMRSAKERRKKFDRRKKPRKSN